MCDPDTVVVFGSAQWDTTGKKGWGTVPNKTFRNFLLRVHRNVQLQDEYLTSQVLPLAPLPPSRSRSNRPPSISPLIFPLGYDICRYSLHRWLFPELNVV